MVSPIGIGDPSVKKIHFMKYTNPQISYDSVEEENLGAKKVFRELVVHTEKDHLKKALQ